MSHIPQIGNAEDASRDSTDACFVGSTSSSVSKTRKTLPLFFLELTHNTDFNKRNTRSFTVSHRLHAHPHPQSDPHYHSLMSKVMEKLCHLLKLGDGDAGYAASLASLEASSVTPICWICDTAAINFFLSLYNRCCWFLLRSTLCGTHTCFPKKNK